MSQTKVKARDTHDGGHDDDEPPEFTAAELRVPDADLDAILADTLAIVGGGWLPARELRLISAAITASHIHWVTKPGRRRRAA